MAPDDPTTSDDSGRSDDKPAAVRQVQGALGSSQGEAGAREADPVLQPSAEHIDPEQDRARAKEWVSDKPIEQQAGVAGGEKGTQGAGDRGVNDNERDKDRDRSSAR
jgi:hypothetical protein